MENIIITAIICATIIITTAIVSHKSPRKLELLVKEAPKTKKETK